MIWPFSLLTKPRPDRSAATTKTELAIIQLSLKVGLMNKSVEALTGQVATLGTNLNKALGLLGDYKKKLDDALANGISEDQIQSIADELGKDNEALAAAIAPAATTDGGEAAATAAE